MMLGVAGLVAFPCALSLAWGLISSRWANQHVGVARKLALLTAGLNVTFLGLASLGYLRYGAIDVPLLKLPGPLSFNLGVYFDSLTVVMTLLVSFIGLVIVRFSVRYLDGDAAQGRFLRWVLVTLGAVLTMIVARNLVMFTVAWMLSSYGLHKLLIHYAERPWAVWAARKKFLISRLGDCFLVGALVCSYQCFGSFDYSSIFVQFDSLVSGTDWLANDRSWWLQAMGILLVLGAMTKSAQVPFHSWLPDTLETPTPVSALMHAGLINAGGYLVLRLSPIIVQSHWALDFLAIVGALTALMGGMVMLTQTSIKRALAWSTIAQMGFMMLQCGLGAFSAALLHIVAHSLYKAYAFLSSGSALQSIREFHRQETKGEFVGRIASSMVKPPIATASAVTKTACIGALSFMAALAACALASWSWQVDLLSKPGANLLGLVLVMSLAYLIFQSSESGSLPVLAWGTASAFGICWLYLAAWLAFDSWLAQSVAHQTSVLHSTQTQSATAWWDSLVLVAVSGGFLWVLSIQWLANRSDSQAIRRLYVHAANGFYLDIPARQLTAWIWGHRVPTP